MPRIPTSKPDRAPRRPSVGGQVDIRSQDAFFRSIAAASQEAGAAIEKAQAEQQKAIDTKEANDVKIHQIERATELRARLRDADISEHGAIIDEFAANTKRLSFKPGVSKEAREALQQNNDLWIQGLYSQSMEWSAEEAEKDKRNSAEKVLSNAIKEGQIMPAIQAIDDMGLSPELSAVRKEEARIMIDKVLMDSQKTNQSNATSSIKDLLDVQYELGSKKNLDLVRQDSKKKGTWNNELEADYLRLSNSISKKEFDKASAERVAAISMEISKSKGLDDIKVNKANIAKVLSAGEITQEQAYRELESNESKRRSILTTEATKMRDNISLLSTLRKEAEAGLLDEAALEAHRDILGNETVDALINVNIGTQGSIGLDSPEYMEALDDMQKFIGGIPGAWTDKGRKVWDADKGMLIGVGDIIKGNFTQSAKLKLMSTFAAAMFTDATFSDISVFAEGGQSGMVKEDFEPEQPQRDYAKHIAQKLFSKIAKPGVIPAKIKGDTAEEIVEIAEEATAKRSLIDAESAYNLLRSFWNEERISSVTSDNYQDLVDSFDKELKAKIEDSSLRRLEKSSLQFRKQLSEIIGER